MKCLPIALVILSLGTGCRSDDKKNQKSAATQPPPGTTSSPGNNAEAPSGGNLGALPTEEWKEGWTPERFDVAVDDCSENSVQRRRSLDRRKLRATCECVYKTVAFRYTLAEYESRAAAVDEEMRASGVFDACDRRVGPGGAFDG